MFFDDLNMFFVVLNTIISMSEKVKVFFLLASIYTTIFWVFTLLFSGLKNDRPKRYLLLLMIASMEVFIMTYFKYQKSYYWYSVFFPYHAIAVLSLFPGFYLYLLSIISFREKFLKKHYIHFIPAIFFFILFFIIHKIWMTKEEEYTYISQYLFNEPIDEIKYHVAFWVYRICKILYLLSSIVYIFLMYKIYKKHKESVKDIFSGSESADLDWVKHISQLSILVFIFNIIIHIIKNKNLIEYNWLISISYLIFTLFYWLLGFNGFRQKIIFDPYNEKFEKNEEFTNSKITKTDILNYLLNNKPYLNPDVNIYDFCYHFKTNRTYISEIINKEFNMNFRTFINTYRINEAKKMLDENSINGDFSLDYIASKVGFRSYSTFLRVFKQLENKTPIDYKSNQIK